MPEIGEVKNFVDFLNKKIKGKKLIDLIVHKNEIFKNDIKNLIQILKLKDKIVKITNVDSKGKFIFFELLLLDIDNQKSEKHSEKKIGYRYIGNHLGLTGFWSLDKTNNCIMELVYESSTDKTNVIYFNDPRRFGKLLWLSLTELKEKLSKLGPDVLSSEFTENIFLNIMHNPKIQNKIIVSVLSEQDIMSGIGNYLRAEILYDSKIHPNTKVKDLTNIKKKELYHSIVKISKKSYEDGNDYKTLVYGNDIDKYGNPVKKIIINNRTIWFVPNVQILY